MHAGDIFFYVILALSVILPIVKSSKKADNDNKPAGKGMPDFMGNDPSFPYPRQGNKENDDEYIPMNGMAGSDGNVNTGVEPEVSEIRVNEDILKHKKELGLIGNRDEIISEVSQIKPSELDLKEAVSVEEKGSLKLSEDLDDAEKLKKAIIYGEILRTKF